MEEYRGKIAAGIDMMKERGHFGFMVTFTVPHLRFQSCREVTDILYDTWKYFRLKNFKKKFHPYQLFIEDCEIKYWVRVCEYTWGANGWHPHFHCIFWAPNHARDRVLKWEAQLNEFWIRQAKRMAKKYWKAHDLYPNKDHDDLADAIFEAADRRQDAVKISRDGDRVAESNSSDYISGWAADRELTGNVRKEASHEDHYTPYQILELAEFDNCFAQLYVDFCLAVTRKPVHHRVNFSKQDKFLTQIMTWRAARDKPTETVRLQKKRRFQVVTCFDAADWFTICYLDRYAPVLSNILYLAADPSLEDVLFEYLRSLGVKIRRRRGDAVIPILDVNAAPCLVEVYERKRRYYLPSAAAQAWLFEKSCADLENLYNQFTKTQ